MKDAFGKKLSIGDQVIYSTKGGGGTEYIIGDIAKLYPEKKTTPDKVSVKVKKTNHNWGEKLKDPIVYASNVVLFKD